MTKLSIMNIKNTAILITIRFAFLFWVIFAFCYNTGEISGSGGTTFYYVLLITVFLISILGTLIWSAADYKRKNHEQLFYWLTVVLRFYVGFTLLHYGLAKLNNGQFPDLYAYRLLSTYGDSSPMGLAWSFLSYSKGYKWSMCFAELLHGISIRLIPLLNLSKSHLRTIRM